MANMLTAERIWVVENLYIVHKVFLNLFLPPLFLKLSSHPCSGEWATDVLITKSVLKLSNPC